MQTGQTANSIIREDIELAHNVQEVCWVSKPSASIMIETGKDDPENKVSNFLLTSIGQGSDKLHVKYSILVKQYALTEEMYKYFKVLKDANEKTGGIYDRIPAQIFGNIDCCNHMGKALGYFAASSVQTKRIFVTPNEHTMSTKSPYDGCIYVTQYNPRVAVFIYGHAASNGRTIYTQDIYCSDCRTYGSGVQPAFWE